MPGLALAPVDTAVVAAEGTGGLAGDGKDVTGAAPAPVDAAVVAAEGPGRGRLLTSCHLAWPDPSQLRALWTTLPIANGLVARCPSGRELCAASSHSLAWLATNNRQP